jgi:hypothetical protein
VLAALERDLVLGLARGALETKDDLLGLQISNPFSAEIRTVFAFLWKTGLV